MLGMISAGIGIVSGVSNLMGGGGSGGSGGGSQSAGTGGSVYDPFSAQRPQYQSQLQQLMANPGSISSSPMYQFAMDQGLEGVNRSAAAKGMLGSGNRLYELSKFGQGLASQQFGQQEQMLAQLSGAGSGGMNISGGGANQQGWSALGQGLGQLQNTSMGQGLNNWLGGSSGGSGGDVNMTGFQNTADPYGAGGGSAYGSSFNIGG